MLDQVQSDEKIESVGPLREPIERIAVCDVWNYLPCKRDLVRADVYPIQASKPVLLKEIEQFAVPARQLRDDCVLLLRQPTA